MHACSCSTDFTVSQFYLNVHSTGGSSPNLKYPGRIAPHRLAWEAQVPGIPDVRFTVSALKLKLTVCTHSSCAEGSSGGVCQHRVKEWKVIPHPALSCHCVACLLCQPIHNNDIKQAQAWAMEATASCLVARLCLWAPLGAGLSPTRRLASGYTPCTIILSNALFFKRAVSLCCTILL